MVDAARAALPGRPIKALVGGFHFVGVPKVGLFGDSPAAIRAVAEGLAASGIARIITMHCTGRRGFERVRAVVGPGVEYLGVGASVDL